MRLFKSASLLAALSFLLLFPACSKNPKRAIVGRWQGPAPDKRTMEFFEDGTFVMGTPRDEGFSAGGHYSFLSDGRLKQEAGGGAAFKTSTLAFEKETMTTTTDDEKKEKIVYTKVKQ